jgi:copper/silver efflux system protein
VILEQRRHGRRILRGRVHRAIVPCCLQATGGHAVGAEFPAAGPNRDAIARYGLSVRDVLDVVEAAVGGMPVSTAIAGRARFSINLRYAADRRSDPQALRRILVPVQSARGIADASGANTGAGASAASPAMVSIAASAANAGMGGMSGGARMAGPPRLPQLAGSMSPQPTENLLDEWRQPGAAFPLGDLAAVRIVTGPPMIKDENGVVVGYVFADIDPTQRDLGSWVEDAKRLVAARLALPAGYRLQWTGQYEFLAEMEARLRYIVPLTLVLVVALLYLSMRGWPQTFLVLSSLPFAIAGPPARHDGGDDGAWSAASAVGGRRRCRRLGGDRGAGRRRAVVLHVVDVTGPSGLLRDVAAASGPPRLGRRPGE